MFSLFYGVRVTEISDVNINSHILYVAMFSYQVMVNSIRVASRRRSVSRFSGMEVNVLSVSPFSKDSLFNGARVRALGSVQSNSLEATPFSSSPRALHTN